MSMNLKEAESVINDLIAFKARASALLANEHATFAELTEALDVAADTIGELADVLQTLVDKKLEATKL